MYKTKT